MNTKEALLATTLLIEIAKAISDRPDVENMTLKELRDLLKESLNRWPDLDFGKK